MCWFKLNLCPYPHHDPISSLIFNPQNASHWEHCDKPQPWGRLSCGSLIVEHPKDLTKSESALTTEHILATRSGNPEQREKHKHMALPIREQRTPNDSVVLIGAGELRPQGAPCKWCTAVLKLVATKSKEIQKQARAEIAELEKKTDADVELKKLHKQIAGEEQKLDALRHAAWKKARSLMDTEMNGDNDEWEKVQG